LRSWRRHKPNKADAALWRAQWSEQSDPFAAKPRTEITVVTGVFHDKLVTAPSQRTKATSGRSISKPAKETGWSAHF
jgi:hypothetical protein